MKNATHISRQVSDDTYRQQLQFVSTNTGVEIWRWIKQQDIIAEGVQKRLVVHPHVTVKEELANHKHLTIESMVKLSQTANRRVMGALAKHADLPAEIYEQMRQTTVFNLLPELASAREVLTPAQRDFFMRHPNEHVQKAFMSRSDISEVESEWLYQNADPRRLMCLFRSIAFDLPVVNKLLTHAEAELPAEENLYWAVSALCRRGDLPNELQLRIIKMGKPLLVRTMSYYTTFSPEALAEILKLNIPEVADLIARQENLNREQIIMVLKEAKNRHHLAAVTARKDFPADILSDIFAGKYGFTVLVEAYASPSATEEQLLAGVKDPYTPLILQRIAENKGITQRVVDAVTASGDVKALGTLGANTAVHVDTNSPMETIRTRALYRGSIVNQSSEGGYRTSFPPFPEYYEAKEKCDPELWDILYPTWGESFPELIEACTLLAKEEKPA